MVNHIPATEVLQLSNSRGNASVLRNHSFGGLDISLECLTITFQSVFFFVENSALETGLVVGQESGIRIPSRWLSKGVK